MVAYAAADVVHLPALVASLTSDLAATGRLAWHAEECARLAADAVFPAGRADGPRERLAASRGPNALSDRERAFVRALWEVREARARALDRPPFRVLTNERLLRRRDARRQGERDLATLFPGPAPAPAGASPASSEPPSTRAERSRPPSGRSARRGERTDADPALEREVEALKKARDAKAHALGLDPGVLASRAVLTAAARVKRTHGTLSADLLVSAAGLSRWRAELLAN